MYAHKSTNTVENAEKWQPRDPAFLLLLFDIQMCCSFKGFYLLIALPLRARLIFHIWIEHAFSCRVADKAMLITLLGTLYNYY